MSAMITGASGHVGYHLASALVANNTSVTLFGRGIQKGENATSFIAGDVLNVESLKAAIKAAAPKVIYHLAGLNGLRDPTDIYRTNVAGTSALFQALRAAQADSVRVILMSSGGVYGRTTELPITESQALNPLSHYAASKAAMEMVARIASSENGQPVIVARGFNFIGPNQLSPLLHSAVAHQIAKAELDGRNAVVSTGPLDDYRDFIDVRDVVRALICLAELGKPGEVYNICSGVARQALELVEILAGYATQPIELRVQKSGRENTIPFQRGSMEKIRLATGWQPHINFEISLYDTLNFWRAQLATAPDKSF